MLETYVRICYDETMMNRESRKSSHNKIHGIKRADILLIVGCLLAALFLGFFFVIHRETGSTVRILYDGAELKKIPLDSAKANAEKSGDGYYLIICSDDEVSTQYFADKPDLKLSEGASYNLISVADKTVIMEAADCKDQICVHHKPVSSERESIICLPHRLVVEIAGDKNAAVDAQETNSNETSYGPLDGVVR